LKRANTIAETGQEEDRNDDSPSLSIEKVIFRRIVREIVQDLNITMPFQMSAVDALHEATEDYIIERLKRNLE
jgi:histone H3/H4